MDLLVDDMAEERIPEFNRNVQNCKQRDQRLKKKIRISKGYGITVKGITWVNWIPKGKEKDKETEEIFENIITENFPKLILDNKKQIQKTKRMISRISAKNLVPHIICKYRKIKDKEKNPEWNQRIKNTLLIEEQIITLTSLQKLYKQEESGVKYSVLREEK